MNQMIDQNIIINCIKTALQGQDNNIRGQAQHNLICMRNQRPAEFFTICSNIISDEKQSDLLRQSAGTVAGRLLSDKNQNNMKYYWDELNQDYKKNIKDACLGVLICTSVDVMKSAASVIAFIAAIELPRGQMEEVIDVLAENCGNSNINFKNASITTLGFICEQIKNFNQKISEKISQQILAGVIFAIRDNNEKIVRTSLKALQNCLSFLTEMMNNPKYRDTVFLQITQQIQKPQSAQDSYYALYQFVKSASKYLGNYRQQLIKLTEVHLQERGDMAVRNLELWEQIGRDYSDKVKFNNERIGDHVQQPNFMQAVAETVLPSIMKCLLILNQGQQDNTNLRQSATKAISAFAQACDKTVIETITNSVATVLGINQPYTQQATVILFSTICDHPDNEYITGLFANGFQHLFSLLSSNSLLVAKNSLIGFVRLSQTFPAVFLKHKNIAVIINQFFEYLKIDLQHTEVIVNAAQVLVNLSQGVQDCRQPLCTQPEILLTKIVGFFTEKWQYFHQNNQRQINQHIATVILNLVMNLQKRDIILQLIQFMIQQYYKVINTNVADNQIPIEQVLSILHTAILVHKNAVVSSKTLNNICDLINSHIKRFKIQQQSLTLLGACATTFGKMFQDRFKQYWQHIWHSLGYINDATTFKAALSCVGDFARSLQSSFSNQSTMVMKRLIEYINCNTVDRQLKVHMINCIGDLMLSMQYSGELFLDDILSICDICFQAVYELSTIQKEQEYCQTLKSSLIQMYSCLAFTLNNGKKANHKLFTHFGNVATFIVRTCDQSLHPTLQYVKMCLYLIFDSSAFYWGNPQYHDKIKEILFSNQVTNLVNIASKFSKKDEIRQLLDFINSRKRI